MSIDGRYRLGSDVGGTFTDLVLADDQTGDLRTLKVPTRRRDAAAGVAAGISALLTREGARPNELASFVHGTTLATNTVIEGTGAPVGLLVTRGTRDMLELGRLRLGDPTNFYTDKTVPLVPRSRVREVAGRLYASGEEREPLAPLEAVRAVGELIGEGARAIALCFLHSYVNPRHERAAAEAIRQAYPDLPLCLSSTIWPQQREYERAVVTVMNALLLERMNGYLGDLERGLVALGIDPRFLCTKSNGGVMAAREAAASPVELLLSGPAAGVVGAHYLGGLVGEEQLLTLDIGGTSADIAVISGAVPYSTESRVGSYPVLIPTVDVLSIGAGGGSIAWIDESGVLKVGPSSAGSDPGPAGYGKGGAQATVTDAYVATGIIDPLRFLGGTMPLDRGAVDQALAKLGMRLGLSTVETASAILQVATAAMHARLLPFLATRGVAARELTLYAYGGAGPTHAFLLARELGVRRVLVPPSPGALCAVGCLVADLRADFIHNLGVRCDETSLPEIRRVLTLLIKQGRDWIGGQATSVESVVAVSSADMRYAGQSFDLTVPIVGEASAAEIREAFERTYEAVYLHRNAQAPAEIVNLRVQIVGRISKPKDLRPALPRGAARPSAASRMVYLDGNWMEARVLDRYAVGPGASYDGPAIIEQYDTTTFVPPGFSVRADDQWNLIGTDRTT